CLVISSELPSGPYPLSHQCVCVCASTTGPVRPLSMESTNYHLLHTHTHTHIHTHTLSPCSGFRAMWVNIWAVWAQMPGVSSPGCALSQRPGHHRRWLTDVKHCGSFRVSAWVLGLWCRSVCCHLLTTTTHTPTHTHTHTHTHTDTHTHTHIFALSAQLTAVMSFCSRLFLRWPTGTHSREFFRLNCYD